MTGTLELQNSSLSDDVNVSINRSARGDCSGVEFFRLVVSPPAVFHSLQSERPDEMGPGAI